MAARHHPACRLSSADFEDLPCWTLPSIREAREQADWCPADRGLVRPAPLSSANAVVEDIPRCRQATSYCGASGAQRSTARVAAFPASPQP